jgi:hypothetical protein
MWLLPVDSDRSGTVPKTKRVLTCGELTASAKPSFVLGRRRTGVLGTIPSSPTSSKARVFLGYFYQMRANDLLWVEGE